MAIVAGSGGKFSADTDDNVTVTIDDAVGNDRMLIVVGGQSRSPPNMGTPSLASAQSGADQLQRQENVDQTIMRMGVWVWDDAALPTTADDFTLTKTGGNQWLAWQYWSGVDQDSISTPEETIIDEGVADFAYATAVGSVLASDLIVCGGAANVINQTCNAYNGGIEFGGSTWSTKYCVAGYRIGGNFTLGFGATADHTLGVYRFTEASTGPTIPSHSTTITF